MNRFKRSLHAALAAGAVSFVFLFMFPVEKDPASDRLMQFFSVFLFLASFLLLVLRKAGWKNILIACVVNAVALFGALLAQILAWLVMRGAGGGDCPGCGDPGWNVFAGLGCVGIAACTAFFFSPARAEAGEPDKSKPEAVNK